MGDACDAQPGDIVSDGMRWEAKCLWGVRNERDLAVWRAVVIGHELKRCPEVSGVAEMPSGGSVCRAWWWPGDGGPPTMEAT